MRAKKKRVLLFITILLILAAVVVAMGTVFHWPSERFRDDAVYCGTAAAVLCGNWLLATEHSVIDLRCSIPRGTLHACAGESERIRQGLSS